MRSVAGARGEVNVWINANIYFYWSTDEHRCFMVHDKNFWKIFERTKCGPTNSTGSNLNSRRLALRAKPMDGWSNGEGQEARNKNAKDANKTKNNLRA
jgi:hypothetical protein